MKVQPIPASFRAGTPYPYLAVHHVRETIDFLKAAFGAGELEVHAMPDGRIMNAILRVGETMIFLGEKGPSDKAWPAMLYQYVENVDAVFQRAVRAGGKVIREPQDLFYGERSGAIEDPSGNQWWLATRVEDLSPEEMMARAKKAGK